MNRILLILIACSFLLQGGAKGQSLSSVNATEKKLDPSEKKEWHNLYIKGDRVYGTGADKAYEKLIKDKKAKKKIVVAIIDSGVDYEHEDLSENIWTNADEQPGNGKDDDNNGFVDDVHGWNFLVDAEGNDIGMDNLEATRVLRLSKQLEESGESYPLWLTKEMLNRAAEIYNEKGAELANLKQFSSVWSVIDSTAQAALETEDYSYEDVKELEAGDNEDIKNAKQIFAVFRTLGIQKSDLVEISKTADNLEDYYLNISFDPRANFDKSQETYGNNHYEGEHAGHGTHVAGIVAAQRNNAFDAEGIAGDVAEIMILRAVPDGDERDIDVANAVRYAADNGANIINMSFGKGLSPDKELVYEAFEYAASKGVLIVHASGNDADNSDTVVNYPNNLGLSDAAKTSYLTIGALSPKKNKKLLASFSNYGEQTVDMFAPGEDIYSSLPDNEYGFRSGTSMAAPAASGVAALVWAYNPDLSASELKTLLIETGIDLGRKKVFIPGTKEKVRFNTVCSTGKVISAYDALEATLAD